MKETFNRQRKPDPIKDILIHMPRQADRKPKKKDPKPHKKLFN
jgi:hypothetical protein